MRDTIKDYVPVADPKPHMTHINVSVYYSKGGSNFFSGGTDKRGYWASWGPVEVKDNGCVSQILGKGGRVLLAEVARFNQKHLAAWGEKVMPLKERIAEAYVSGDNAAAGEVVVELRRTAA